MELLRTVVALVVTSALKGLSAAATLANFVLGWIVAGLGPEDPEVVVVAVASRREPTAFPKGPVALTRITPGDL